MILTERVRGNVSLYLSEFVGNSSIYILVPYTCLFILGFHGNFGVGR